jgi:dolichyl-diphosphooligosaccharide--protein glycosyltransferase
MNPRLKSVFAAAGLFALAVLVRSLPYGEVFTEGGIRFLGTDPYFHMRAIAWSVAHFPAFQTFDPFIQYPDGARPIVGPLFDWVIALLALPFTDDVAGPGLSRLEHFAVWIPPVLGGLTVVTTWALARRNFNPTVAMIAGSFLALTSGHFWYSRLGMVDHHVAVALLASLQLALALRLIVAPTSGSSGLRYSTVACLGVTVAAAFLVWPGSLLHLALIDVPLAALALFESDPSIARRRAFEVAGVHGLAAAIVFPFSWGNSWPHLSPFSPVVLSEFQPWVLAFIGAGLTISALSWAHPRLGATRRVDSEWPALLVFPSSESAFCYFRN